MAYADEQSYEEMISALQTYVSQVEEPLATQSNNKSTETQFACKETLSAFLPKG